MQEPLRNFSYLIQSLEAAPYNIYRSSDEEISILLAATKIDLYGAISFGYTVCLSDSAYQDSLAVIDHVYPFLRALTDLNIPEFAIIPIHFCMKGLPRDAVRSYWLKPNRAHVLFTPISPNLSDQQRIKSDIVRHISPDPQTTRFVVHGIDAFLEHRRDRANQTYPQTSLDEYFSFLIRFLETRPVFIRRSIKKTELKYGNVLRSLAVPQAVVDELTTLSAAHESAIYRAAVNFLLPKYLEKVHADYVRRCFDIVCNAYFLKEYSIDIAHYNGAIAFSKLKSYLDVSTPTKNNLAIAEQVMLLPSGMFWLPGGYDVRLAELISDKDELLATSDMIDPVVVASMVASEKWQSAALTYQRMLRLLIEGKVEIADLISAEEVLARIIRSWIPVRVFNARRLSEIGSRAVSKVISKSAGDFTKKALENQFEDAIGKRPLAWAKALFGERGVITNALDRFDPSNRAVTETVLEVWAELEGLRRERLVGLQPVKREV